MNMRSLKLALLATAATAALTSATMAADLIMDVPDQPTVVDNSFTWDGAYFGAFVTGQSVPAAMGLGVVIGANGTTDSLLFGGELEANWLSDGSWTAQADGRLGVFVADNAVLYGFGGIGSHSVNGTFIPVGAGIEFGLADNLSLKTEYQFNWDLSSAAQDSHVVKAGLNWHF
jgi:opacity protein-like surface antigen